MSHTSVLSNQSPTSNLSAASSLLIGSASSPSSPSSIRWSGLAGASPSDGGSAPAEEQKRIMGEQGEFIKFVLTQQLLKSLHVLMEVLECYSVLHSPRQSPGGAEPFFDATPLAVSASCSGEGDAPARPTRTLLLLTVRKSRVPFFNKLESETRVLCKEQHVSICTHTHTHTHSCCCL